MTQPQLNKDVLDTFGITCLSKVKNYVYLFIDLRMHSCQKLLPALESLKKLQKFKHSFVVILTEY